MKKTPQLSLDILVMRDSKILLSLLSDRWLINGKQVYGIPGRNIGFRETIGDAVRRNIKEEIDCAVTSYEIISINANYEWENHFIGIGVVAQIKGEPKLLHPEDWVKWEWLDIRNLPSNLFPSARNAIESYRTNRITVSE